MTRIYTKEEAAAMLADAQSPPWSSDGDCVIDSGGRSVSVWGFDADLMSAAPDLAASVIHHAERADKAEAEAAEWKRRAEEAEAALASMHRPKREPLRRLKPKIVGLDDDPFDCDEADLWCPGDD